MFLKEGRSHIWDVMCELDWKENSEPKRTSLRARLSDLAPKPASPL